MEYKEVWRKRFRALTQLGTSPSYSAIENMSITWVNFIALTFICVALFYYLDGSWLMFHINNIGILLNILPLYYNYKNRPLLAKKLLINPPIVYLLIVALLFTKFTWISLYLLSIQVITFMFLPFIVFAPNEQKYIYRSFFLGLFCLIFYAFVGPYIPPIIVVDVISFSSLLWAVFLCMVLVIMLGIAYYRKLVHQYTDSLLAQNQEIEQQKIALNKKNEELEALNQKLSGTLDNSNDFLQMVSHDLKSPVNAIIGLTDIIQGEKDLLKVRQYNDYVLHSAQKALHLIESLRQITLLERETFSIQKKDFFLDKLVEEVVHQNTVNANQKGQIIHATIQENIKAFLDPIKTYQVVDNILNNAVKYSPKKSEISIQLCQKENNAIVTIKDKGQGFLEEEKVKLFRKFSRLSSRPTGNEIATGLGLFICKRLVELHQGTITAESEGKNKGATFTITLPLSLGSSES